MESLPEDFRAKLLASYQRSATFLNEHNCPRGSENSIFKIDNRAVWTVDDCCSYCGSLHPDVFMARLELGTVILEPTDKNYKVYVKALPDTDRFKETYRGGGDPGGHDPALWKWTTREQDQTKFYFQHLATEQKQRFVKLLNQKKIKLDHPGHFYRLPFFISCDKEDK